MQISGTFIRLAFAAVAALTCGVGAAADRPVYSFSPVNQYGLQLTAGFWNPVIDYVSSKSGVPLRLKLGRTSADTTSFVLAQEVDIAFANHLFSPDREKMGWRVFVRGNAEAMRGQIVVPADSPVTSLAELADREVAFPGPEAFVAYKVPYAHLPALNIPVKVVFAGNMDSAFTQLFSGRAKAMGANSQLVPRYAERERKAFRVLWTSEPYNDLALMASSRVPERDVQAVTQAFLNMHNDPEGRAILQQVSDLVKAPKLSHFLPASDADYNAYRVFYKSAPVRLR